MLAGLADVEGIKSHSTNARGSLCLISNSTLLCSSEQLERLKPGLEIGNISKMDDLEPKVAELSRIQLEQREAGEQVTEETLELVQRYNDIISSLSEAFLHADKIVSKAEAELDTKG